ncbi:MAG: dethiobiotin synthase [Deltaproteobacteria bacterium]|nr:dethiobiotin synthase [Deltaproteobacteria bacterium]
MNKDIGNLFVVGTDTGVGKTVLCLLMMQFFFSRGYTPFYLKPVQTGCREAHDIDSDARFIYQHVESLRDREPAESVVYCFRNPKAPLFAARDEGKTIDLEIIEQAVAEKAQSFSPLILEGAGGALVPVAGKTLIADMITRTDGKPVIAARAGLGTINHTLLTIEALWRRGLTPLGVIFIDAGDAPIPPAIIEENRWAIEDISGVKVAGVIKKISHFSEPPPDCYLPLENMFGKIG